MHKRTYFDSLFGCYEMEEVAWHIYSEWMQDKEMYPVFSIYAFPESMLVGVANMLAHGWIVSAAPENQEFTVSADFVHRVYGELIAVAFELLATCKMFVRHAEVVQNLDCSPFSVDGEAIVRAEKAIAKAEGTSDA